MNAYELYELLEQLSEQRAQALREASLVTAICALSEERFLGGETDEGRYVDVVFLKDSATSADGLMEAKNVEYVCPESANCALLLNEEGIVYGAVNTRHEYQSEYWIGVGFCNGVDVKRYGDGTRVPKSCKIYRVWFENGKIVPMN